jgi:acetyl esterase/lipase
VRGDSLFADWFPVWILELAETHSAVIISANYRFLPEVTGSDILDDIDDFWSWLHSAELISLLESQTVPIKLDLDRILTAGESAGGLLSIDLALSHPDRIRAATAAYPQLYIDYLAHHPSPTSLDALDVPESVIQKYLEYGEVESSAVPPSRVELSGAIMQYRKGLELYARGFKNSPHRERLFPYQRLEKEQAKLPRGGLVIIHGLDDDDVLAEGSEKFINRARKLLKDRQDVDNVILSLQPGGHGFDSNVSIKEPWLNNALKTAVSVWVE